MEPGVRQWDLADAEAQTWRQFNASRMHNREPGPLQADTVCWNCGEPWPCPDALEQIAAVHDSGVVRRCWYEPMGTGIWKGKRLYG